MQTDHIWQLRLHRQPMQSFSILLKSINDIYHVLPHLPNIITLLRPTEERIARFTDTDANPERTNLHPLIVLSKQLHCPIRIKEIETTIQKRQMSCKPSKPGVLFFLYHRWRLCGDRSNLFCECGTAHGPRHSKSPPANAEPDKTSSKCVYGPSTPDTESEPMPVYLKLNFSLKTYMKES